MDENWDSDDEFEEEYETDDEYETETVACSNCGADVYEDAVSCPACGEYLGVNTHPFSDRPRWWVALGVLGSIVTILCLIFFA
ncbi:zinc ribbon domain-containing protein [uncultured Gimesia sp.]|uniref:zinc ribbon domain-containing protein n=1 Tax=uncultured Gimesia sp. TaxID=1678688 RepID=UPI00262D0A30|nr:zinc ribbon domain-containing protein [uncultured Gimesia sp.]